MHGNLAERTWTTEDLDLVDKKASLEAFESFWAYRRYINPRMILGPRTWWQREVALELHRFWLEYQAGRRPKLLLQSPPQHGKSVMVVDFLSWVAGLDRNLKLLFSSFSDRLGLRANLRLQRIFASNKHISTFKGSLLQGGMQQNSKTIEFAGGEGYFRNTTVLGSVTGEALDIGIIDDPIKGRAEASSRLTRDNTWHWFTDDFLTRFSDRAGLIMIMTRWHLDDPAGRLIDQYPGVRVLRYPAIAEHDEKLRYPVGDDDHARKAGEPLFPELKSLEFLKKQRNIMTVSGWQSIYQQSPIMAGGDTFPIHMFGHVNQIPRKEVKRSVRYIDKAGSEGHGAYTAMVLMHLLEDGRYIVEDVQRGQWSALQREKFIEQVVKIDASICPRYEVWVEQEPGSGGKESAENTIRRLGGFKVFADRVTGSKEVRAEPYAAQVQAGNVFLKVAEWNRRYLDEHETFPAGKFKDQVDASSGAFAKLVIPKINYDTTMSWIDGTPLRG